MYAFLDWVAGDLTAVYAALPASRRDAAILKHALHRWQTDQTGARTDRGLPVHRNVEDCRRTAPW